MSATQVTIMNATEPAVRKVKGVKSTEVGFIDNTTEEWVPEDFLAWTYDVVINISTCRIRLQDDAWATLTPMNQDYTFKMMVYTTQTGAGVVAIRTLQRDKLVPYFRNYVRTSTDGNLAKTLKFACCSIWVGVPALQLRLDVNEKRVRYRPLHEPPRLLLLQSTTRRIASKHPAPPQSVADSSDESPPPAKRMRCSSPETDAETDTSHESSDAGSGMDMETQDNAEEQDLMPVGDTIAPDNHRQQVQTTPPRSAATTPSPEEAPDVWFTPNSQRANADNHVDDTGASPSDGYRSALGQDFEKSITSKEHLIETGTAQDESAGALHASTIAVNLTPAASEEIAIPTSASATDSSNSDIPILKAAALKALNHRYNGSPPPSMVAILGTEASALFPHYLASLPGFPEPSSTYLDWLRVVAGSAVSFEESLKGNTGIAGQATVDETGENTMGVTGEGMVDTTGEGTVGETGEGIVGEIGEGTVGITGEGTVGMTGEGIVGMTGEATVGMTGEGTVGTTGGLLTTHKNSAAYRSACSFM